MGTVKDDEAGWQRVAEWLQREIEQQGLTLRRIETEGKVAYRTVQKLRDGEGVARRDALSRLSTFLGYRADAIDRVRRGEHPVHVNGDGDGDGEMIDLNRAAASLPVDARRRVLDFIEQIEAERRSRRS